MADFLYNARLYAFPALFFIFLGWIGGYFMSTYQLADAAVHLVETMEQSGVTCGVMFQPSEKAIF